MKNLLLIIVVLLCSCNSTKYISVLATNEKDVVAKELDLIYTRNLFFVDGYLNGKKARFLVDTGANVSVLDINKSKKYGFTYRDKDDTVVGIGGYTKRYRVYSTKLKTKYGENILIKFSGGDMSVVFGVMSNEGINVVGIIGSDFLMNSDAIIDYKNRTLQLYGTRI